MSAQLVWTDRAKRRVLEIGEFISERDPDRAQRVIGDLFDRVAILAEQPRIGIAFPGSPTDRTRSTMTCRDGG